MTNYLGILIYDGVQPMDFIGPWEVFSFWQHILNAPIELCLISESGGEVHCDNQITVKAHYDFQTSPPLDYLLVPGGIGRRTQVNNPNIIRFIQQQNAHCKYILSVCTGMFLLYQAGLLQNQHATTYWRAVPELQVLPNVIFEGKRIVKNGRIWTASGVTSGIDLALAFIQEIADEETAGKVQLLMEYFPKGTVYCGLDTFKKLPPYSDLTPTLPDYIRDVIKQKINGGN